MQQRVGTCSICGGSVMGYRGAWMSVNPPPLDRCDHCGATRGLDVIPMTPRSRKEHDFLAPPASAADGSLCLRCGKQHFWMGETPGQA